MNILSILDLTEADILNIFKLADQLKEKPMLPLLDHKTFILFFPESSIRTRITFEKAISDLGGKSILFPPSTLDKREALKDVIGYLENWADGVIIRHGKIDLIKEIAIHSNIPIINAMTSDNHPCEILSDLYAISKRKPNFRNLKYVFVGENANISRSYARIAKVLKLNFDHVCIGDQAIFENSDHYRFSNDLDKALKDADVVLTDGIPKEYLTDDYLSHYQITLERLKLAKEDAILNPCPPFYRGEEVHAEVIDSKYFVGYDFKKDLLTVQQAIILYALGIRSIDTNSQLR